MSLEPDDLAAASGELGQMLRELRRTAGLSGERLARRCSMSQSKIETGRLAPALVDLDRILTALGATAEQAGLGLPSEYLDSPHPWLTAEGESWGSTSEQRRTEIGRASCRERV